MTRKIIESKRTNQAKNKTFWASKVITTQTLFDTTTKKSTLKKKKKIIDKIMSRISSLCHKEKTNFISNFSCSRYDEWQNIYKKKSKAKPDSKEKVNEMRLVEFSLEKIQEKSQKRKKKMPWYKITWINVWLGCFVSAAMLPGEITLCPVNVLIYW